MLPISMLSPPPPPPTPSIYTQTHDPHTDLEIPCAGYTYVITCIIIMMTAFIQRYSPLSSRLTALAWESQYTSD